MDEHRSHGPALKFQSTHPARGATAPHHRPVSLCFYFNPRTPRGVRRIFTAIRPSGRSFQSTHPARGATRDIRTLTKESFYISIHAPREGCDTMARAIDGELLISIHAPREGCDVQPYLRPYCIPISIHAPREGCDEHLTEADFVLEAFQSTHPARGATLLRPAKGGQPGHFNPRTPRGVRPSGWPWRIR